MQHQQHNNTGVFQSIHAVTSPIATRILHMCDVRYNKVQAIAFACNDSFIRIYDKDALFDTPLCVFQMNLIHCIRLEFLPSSCMLLSLEESRKHLRQTELIAYCLNEYATEVYDRQLFHEIEPRDGYKPEDFDVCHITSRIAVFYSGVDSYIELYRCSENARIGYLITIYPFFGNETLSIAISGSFLAVWSSSKIRIWHITLVSASKTFFEEIGKGTHRRGSALMWLEEDVEKELWIEEDNLVKNSQVSMRIEFEKSGEDLVPVLPQHRDCLVFLEGEVSNSKSLREWTGWERDPSCKVETRNDIEATLDLVFAAPSNTGEDSVVFIPEQSDLDKRKVLIYTSAIATLFHVGNIQSSKTVILSEFHFDRIVNHVIVSDMILFGVTQKGIDTYFLSTSAQSGQIGCQSFLLSSIELCTTFQLESCGDSLTGDKILIASPVNDRMTLEDCSDYEVSLNRESYVNRLHILSIKPMEEISSLLRKSLWESEASECYMVAAYLCAKHIMKDISERLRIEIEPVTQILLTQKKENIRKNVRDISGELGRMYLKRNNFDLATKLLAKSSLNPLDVMPMFEDNNDEKCDSYVLTAYLIEHLTNPSEATVRSMHESPDVTHSIMLHFKEFQPHLMSQYFLGTCLFWSMYDPSELLNLLDQVISITAPDYDDEDALFDYKPRYSDLFVRALLCVELERYEEALQCLLVLDLDLREYGEIFKLNHVILLYWRSRTALISFLKFRRPDILVHMLVCLVNEESEEVSYSLVEEICNNESKVSLLQTVCELCIVSYVENMKTKLHGIISEMKTALLFIYVELIKNPSQDVLQVDIESQYRLNTWLENSMLQWISIPSTESKHMASLIRLLCWTSIPTSSDLLESIIQSLRGYCKHTLWIIEALDFVMKDNMVQGAMLIANQHADALLPFCDAHFTVIEEWIAVLTEIHEKRSLFHVLIIHIVRETEYLEHDQLTNLLNLANYSFKEKLQILKNFSYHKHLRAITFDLPLEVGASDPLRMQRLATGQFEKHVVELLT